MAKSNAERQREFKARRGNGEFQRLDVLLPIDYAELLSGNAKRLGITKAAYIVKLLHGNALQLDGESEATYTVSNKPLPGKHDKPLFRTNNTINPLSGNDELTHNGYDGTTPLQPEIAKLLGCSVKSQAKIAKTMKAAKQSLGITTKARVLPPETRVQLFNYIKSN